MLYMEVSGNGVEHIYSLFFAPTFKRPCDLILFCNAPPECTWPCWHSSRLLHALQTGTSQNVSAILLLCDLLLDLCGQACTPLRSSERHTFARILSWGGTFFLQDVVVILLARIVTEAMPWSIPRLIAAAEAAIVTYVKPVADTTLISVLNARSLSESLMASAKDFFCVVTGAEIHWR